VAGEGLSRGAGDAKLTDLLVTLVDCLKARSISEVAPRSGTVFGGG
jgi:hypothetical protein